MIKDLFFKPSIRQHRVTQLLKRLQKGSTNNIYTVLQSQLYIVLVQSHFFLFKSDAISFIKTVGVYVNGVVVTDYKRVLRVGSIVQLPIYSRYFYYFKYSRGFEKVFLKKFRAKFAKIALTYRSVNLQRSKITPV